MNELPLSILDTNEFYACTSRILNIVKESLTTDTYATRLCNKIGSGVTNMEKAIGRSLKSNFTTLLFDADKERDSRFVGLRDYLKSSVHSKDKAKASAAIKLYQILQNIGTNIHKLGYADQTVKTNTLIARLSTPEATEFLQTAGATALFKDLEADNLAFETIYKTKAETEGEINVPLLKDSKNAITKAINALLIYIDSNAEDQPLIFNPLINNIEVVITEILTIAHARITREENEKKATNPPIK